MTECDAGARPSQVRDWLERQIREGTLRPGDRLDEQALCRRFEISRTPVREALLQLASLDLVTFKPRQGAVVTTLSVREIVAMWEVLTCLEGFCAGLAARRLDERDLAELRAIHETGRALLASGDVGGYADMNQRFHEAIYGASRNPYLGRQVRDIRSRLQAYRRYPFRRPGGLERSFAGHEAVMAALSAGQDTAATIAMSEHVAGAMSFVDLIAELPAGEPQAPSPDRARPPPSRDTGAARRGASSPGTRRSTGAPAGKRRPPKAAVTPP